MKVLVKKYKTKRFNCYRCSNRSSLYLNIVVLEASWFVFLFILKKGGGRAREGFDTDLLLLL